MRSQADTPELRPLLIPAAALFLLLAGLYVFSIGLRATTNAAIAGDEPFYLLTTQSLIDDRNLDLRAQYERESYLEFFEHPDGLWKQSVPDADGRILSPHEPGLSVLLIPGFALGGLRGAQVELLLVAALTFALTFVLAALETGARRLAWVVTAVVGLAAPGFVYSTEIYPEMPAALCLVTALLVLRCAKGQLRSLVLVFALSALAWLGLKYVPLGLIVAVFYLFGASNRERATFVGLGLVSAGAFAWAHLAWFGALTPYNGNTVYEGAPTSAVIESHLAFEGRLYRIWGLFIDRRFGIGRWAPVFLAILPALPLLPRAGRQGSLVLCLVLTQILIATFVAITMMGWWFPGRMLMVVYPLFAVALTVAAVRIPRPAVLVGAAAGAYSLLVTSALVVAAGNRDVRIAVDPFAMDTPLFRWAGPLFPQYTWWRTETIILNAIWVAAGLSVTAAVTWRTYGSALRRLGTPDLVHRATHTQPRIPLERGQQ